MPSATDSSAAPRVSHVRAVGRTSAMTASAVSRGLQFGTAAERCERFRLGYPDEVVDRTLAYADSPVTRALEVGAGTGKATRAFASRGIAITAVEPDEDMHAVLERETAGMPVVAVRCTFEAYDGPPSGLVYGTAFHRTDPAIRWSHAADLLHQRGVLALIDSRLRAKDQDVEAALTGAWRDQVEDPTRQPSSLTRAEARGLFADVEHHRVEREVTLSQQEYVGHVTTLSAFLRLSWPDRQRVLGLAFDLLPEQVLVDASVELHLARRV